ncbi:hypothetical protein ADICYQ_1079 [Cyclobacterium qasimii M12-11B]|uniref:Uncharacterized protein n=1 Tax=Cyclobacterium qasimii M12-11B TaxID=641524 RepID=S7VJ35_9BACT|nr:hypothetical protein ADICYQ_1079 [Cyclobacterium qasimii M12-11B]
MNIKEIFSLLRLGSNKQRTGKMSGALFYSLAQRGYFLSGQL